MLLDNAKIKSYLNAPFLASFGTLREEATKFLISQHHDAKLWLPVPIEITTNLIRYIYDLPASNDPIPMGSKNSPLIKEFIRIKAGKNSKGVIINHIQYPIVKWIAITICLTVLGCLSDIK